MELVSMLGDALSGGLFGLIGNVASKAVGVFEAREIFAQKKEEWGHEERMADMAMKAKAAEAADMRASTAASGSWTGLCESLKAEGAIGVSYPWVNAVRALVRPVLTVGLCGFLSAAFFALPATDAARGEISGSLVFAAVTAVVWWFGDRAKAKA
ncbi:hypothetical protein FHS83_000941 [Rhizomicrobium palustre]|uniref:Holin of 3TMs, for gene-transfer release n=1 Tax=Rhizomicrobium palustre TaxID=189966 RepID=A0A846MW99_9PROT|nr:hypothetical protein [Rhizomicrobium palustre]NIK87623.1 hypothetical protein [Rhizomicrobium palustre]